MGRVLLLRGAAPQRLNNLLRERGYPVKIALGFAFSAAIDSSGGDEAYFGRDGSKVIPQYLPDNVIGNRPRRLEAPGRKADVATACSARSFAVR